MQIIFHSNIECQNTENYQWSVLKAPNSASPQYNEIPQRRFGHTAIVYKDLVSKTTDFSENLDQIFNLFHPRDRFTSGEAVTRSRTAMLYTVSIPALISGLSL